jgi:hypothetical protein
MVRDSVHSAHATRQLSLRSKSMAEIVHILANHACPDITHQLSDVWDHPPAFGRFGDVYRGYLKDGTQVALKVPRLYVGNDDTNNVLHMTAVGQLNNIQ